MTKFSETKFDNRHRLYNSDLASSFNTEVKMPLYQKDLTIPEIYRRYKDEIQEEYHEEHEKDRMRMTMYTEDSNYGVYK